MRYELLYIVERFAEKIETPSCVCVKRQILMKKSKNIDKYVIRRYNVNRKEYSGERDGTDGIPK